MKIAYILKMYPRFSETFIVNEILELERRGARLRIYSLRKPDDGRFHDSLARVRASVVYVPQYPLLEREKVWTAHRALLAADRERYLSVLRYAVARGHRYAIKRFLQSGVIAAHLLRHPVDALHAHFATSATRAAIFVNRLTGVPFSFTAHAKDIYHENVRANSLRGKMQAARFVVTVSDFNRAYLQELAGADAQRADIRRLYNGIDLSRFRPQPDGRRDEPLILSVGRLVEKKGFEVLIQACALLTAWGLPYRCEIIGKGARKAALQALIEQRGLQAHVRLVGPRPQEAVRDAYQRAAVFALPCVVGSDGNRDGLPTVLLEAMASGLPVVSTALTGIPEIITPGEDGLLVAPGDAAALADALTRLLSEPDLSERLARAARRKVEREFDLRTNAGVLHAWLAAGVAAPNVSASLTTGYPTPTTAQTEMPYEVHPVQSS